MALGIEVEDRPFAKSTLQLFRARLILHEKVREVFERSLRFARETGYLKSRRMKVALDTTYILGRGAVKDTYNLLSDGIVKLVPRGYDAGKKINGRKRHVIVDTVGLLLAVVVHPANIQDRDGARLVIDKLIGRFPRLRLIWADAGYSGQLVDWVMSMSGWVLEIVKRPRASHQFEVLPRRWVVERTLAWLGRCRRLSKDYEALTGTTEAWLHIAAIHLMLRRLAPS